jgi:pSer/pThr/pTyr-binding forkhead associated (FHA) protein
MEHNHWVIVQDDQGLRELMLDAPSYSIGRDPKCDICLVTQFASRRHATLIKLQNEAENSYYRIIDGNGEGQRSSNGLLVHGRKVQVHDLQDQDEVVFGPQVRIIYSRTGGNEDFSPGINVINLFDPPDEDFPPNFKAGRPRRPRPFTPEFGAEALLDEEDGMSSIP